MELPVLLLADYANIAQGGKLNVMGIFSQIYAAGFPARHPAMQLVMHLSVSPAEYNTTRKLTVKLLDEDGKALLNWTEDIPIPEQEPGRRLQIGQILQLNDIVFPHPGTYQFSVLVDLDEKGTYPLYVLPIEAAKE